MTDDDGEPMLARFQQAVEAVIHEYGTGHHLTVAEAVGTLRVIEARILRDALNKADEEDE